MQTTVGELLEEVMRVNTSLIDQMCDEGLNTLDNMTKDPATSEGTQLFLLTNRVNYCDVQIFI